MLSLCCDEPLVDDLAVEILDVCFLILEEKLKGVEDLQTIQIKSHIFPAELIIKVWIAIAKS